MSRKFIGVIDVRRLPGQRYLMMMIQRHKIITATEAGALSICSTLKLARLPLTWRFCFDYALGRCMRQIVGGDGYGEFEQSIRAAADE